jgi:chromate reductase
LLRAAQQLLPPGAVLEIADLGDIPHFNGDVLSAGAPPVVMEFKTRIRQADALLIANDDIRTRLAAFLAALIDWARLVTPR